LTYSKPTNSKADKQTRDFYFLIAVGVGQLPTVLSDMVRQPVAEAEIYADPNSQMDQSTVHTPQCPLSAWCIRRWGSSVSRIVFISTISGCDVFRETL